MGIRGDGLLDLDCGIEVGFLSVSQTSEHGAGLGPRVAWRVSTAPVGYETALAQMNTRAVDIADGRACELIWLLEHPPLFTAGTSAKPNDLLWPNRFPVIHTGRGGQYTYHGPGQRVVYVMLDLRKRGGCDVRAFVDNLQGWMIDALAVVGVSGEARCDQVGVWVRRPEVGPDVEDKIAAVGIRLRRWVSLHGFSINVAPDLSHYGGIVACGNKEHGVTSLEQLGVDATMSDLDGALRMAFCARFGDVLSADELDTMPSGAREEFPSR